MRYALLLLAVFALPASAQNAADDGTVIIRQVPPPTVEVYVADSVAHPIDLDVSVVVPQEMLASQIAEANSNASVGAWVDRGLWAAGILVAALGVHELRRFVNRWEPDVENNTTNIDDRDETTVNVDARRGYGHGHRDDK